VSDVPTLEQRVAALEASLASLLGTLIRRGDITINDARATMGLPEFREDFANERLRML
jgi:hypothetical protein